MPENWEISKYRRIQWTKDDSWFEFGISAPMIEPDTTLLDEEIVNVEIWNYQDGRLYTQQEIRGDEEKKRSYSVIYNPDEERFISVTGKDRSEVRFAPDLVGPYAAVYNELPYLKYISWLGYSYKDLYSVNLQNGESLLIAKKIQGNVSVSPGAIY